MAWHGADLKGSRARQSYCEAWHSDKSSHLGLASDLLQGQLMGQQKVGCNHKLIVLCIEIASQQNYRRRRRSTWEPLFQNGTLLTYEEYTQFLDIHDSQSPHPLLSF